MLQVLLAKVKLLNMKKNIDIINFHEINFHDCYIHAFAFDEDKYELLLDVDFITKIINKENAYLFDISPSTFVFSNVWDVQINIDMNLELYIEEIIREYPRSPKNAEYLPSDSFEYDWKIQCFQGCINLKSIGLIIHKRNTLKMNTIEHLSLFERGFLSFKKEGEKLLVI